MKDAVASLTCEASRFVAADAGSNPVGPLAASKMRRRVRAGMQATPDKKSRWRFKSFSYGSTTTFSGCAGKVFKPTPCALHG